MSCKIWIITRYLFKKFNPCWLLLMEMSCSNCHRCFWLCTCLRKCKPWIESMMAMLGARWSQPISRRILGLALGKLVAWVTCSIYKTTMKTLCALVFTMKSFGAVSAHIFQLWVRWHYLHPFPPLHANFVIFLPCVWQIVLDKFIMLCIDYHQSLEWLFILGSISILWWMANAGDLWRRLEGWL
jgi:hypothetical protein